MAVEKAAFDNTFGSLGIASRISRVALEKTLDQFEHTFSTTSKQDLRRKLKENIGKIEVRIQPFDGEKKA